VDEQRPVRYNQANLTVSKLTGFGGLREKREFAAEEIHFKEAWETCQKF
jgi:hypothetical protein